MNLKPLLWQVSPLENGISLIVFLKKRTKTKISNRLLKSVIEKGICKVNHLIETFASKKLKTNDRVQLEKNWETKIIKSKQSLPKVLYEDDYLKIIDKKAGFLCDDKEVQKYFPEWILVHRLDKPTSGALILAKNEAVKKQMKELFKKKEVKKIYIAIVDGKIKEKKIKRESFLQRKKNFEGKIIWAEAKNQGLYALSLFEVLKGKDNYTVLKCLPITGRTHQLRVHLNSMGHPILGDIQYARHFKCSKMVERLMLHSLEISFMHPILKKWIKVKAAIPVEFKSFYI